MLTEKGFNPNEPVPRHQSWHPTPWLLGCVFLAPILGWISFLGLMTAVLVLLAKRTNDSTRSTEVVNKWVPLAVLSAFALVLMASNWLHTGDVAWWKDLRFLLPLIAPCLLLGSFHKAEINPATIRVWAILGVWSTIGFTSIEYLYFTEHLHISNYRARALSANPLFVSGMLVPLIFLIWLDIEDQTTRQRGLSVVTHVAGLLCLSAALGARMSVLIVLILTPGVVWYGLRRVPEWRNKTFPLLAMLLLLLMSAGAVLAWTSPSFVSRFVQIIEFLRHPNVENFADESIRFRAVHWVSGWQAFLERPWTGYGFENERAALAIHQAPGAAILSTSHQQYLSFAIGAGIIGLMTGLLYLFLPLILAFLSERTPQRIYAASALALPMMLNGLTDTFFDDIRLLSYHTVMTLLLASVRYPRASLNAPLPQTSRRA